MSNVISSGWDTSRYFLHQGFSGTIKSSFASPEANASDLACDGPNIISATATSNFRHVGFSSAIQSSYLYPALGITWDGTNAITTGNLPNRHVRHVGFSLTVESSFAAPGGNPQGLGWDGTNLLCTDGTYYKHYLHSGFSTTITNSYFATADKLTWNGDNVISSSVYSGRHYKHVGFSPTVIDCYLAPDDTPGGIAWGDPQMVRVPGNVLSIDIAAIRMYRHVSFTASIESSYPTPGPSPSGITWDTFEEVPLIPPLSHVQTTDTTTQKHYQCDGFSDSIVASYASPGTNPVGISWLEWYVPPCEGGGDYWAAIGVSIDADTCKMYLHSEFSSSIADCYNTPGPAPRDIVYDQTPSVITSDAFYDKHYQHIGFSESINVSYASPGPSPYGITWTGTYDVVYLQTDVISADNDTNKHYRHWSLTATIEDSYTSPGTDPAGISFDGRYPVTLPTPPPANVISADSANKRFYWHIGFSSSIAASVVAPGNYPTGIGATSADWEAGGGQEHIITVDGLEDKHFLHVQFSETITDSYTSPNDYPTGIAWDGSSVISAGHGTTDMHYQHDGFSDTITNSYVSPNVQPSGLEWNIKETDVISADYSAMRHYWHVDFSASIRSSYTSPSGYPTGIAMFEGINVMSADSTQVHFLHIGFSATIAMSYASPGPWPYGMTWAVGDPFWPIPPAPDPGPQPFDTLVSADEAEHRLYLHDRLSTSILESYTSPSSGPWGVSIDSAFNILSMCESSSAWCYKHHWFSSTIVDSVQIGGTHNYSITWDMYNLITVIDNTFRRYEGFSTTITDSLVSGHKHRGVSWTPSPMWVSMVSNGLPVYWNVHWQYSGFSLEYIRGYTTHDFVEYSRPHDVCQVVWDQAEIYGLLSALTAPGGFARHCLFDHTGESVIITWSGSSPGSSPRGVEWGTTKRVSPPKEWEVLLASSLSLKGEMYKGVKRTLTGVIIFEGLAQRALKLVRSVFEGVLTFIGTLTTRLDKILDERRITQLLTEVDQDVGKERRATQLVLEVDLEETSESFVPIDEINYLDFMDVDSLQITEGLGPHGDTCSFTVTIPNNLIPDTVSKPKSGSPIIITLYSIVYFKGIIGVITEDPVNPDVTRYSCECTDFTHWLDRKLIIAERPEELAGTRIKALVNWIGTYLSGFPFTDFTYVSDGLTVESASYEYITLSSILDEIAEACHYQWYVDFEKRIHFFDLEESVSPLNVDYGNLLNLDDPSNLDLGDVAVTEDVTQLKNRVYIKDYAEKGDVKYPDGPYPYVENQSFYKLYQEPWNWEETEVAVAGEPVLDGLDHGTRVVSLDPLDGASETLIGSIGEAYVCIFNMGVRFPSADLPEGAITVWYYPAIPDQISTYEDIYSIAFMADREGSSGVHEFMISVPSLRVESVDRIEAIGEYLLRRYAWPYRSGSLITITFPHMPDRLGLPGWHPGMYFRLTSEAKDLYDYEDYWKSGKTNKNSITMYVLRVTRNFAEVDDEAGGVTLMVRESVEFANQPYPL